MKKLLAVVLTIALLMSVSPMAYGFSLESFFGSAGEFPETLDLNVDSNIQVKLDSDTDFEEGPIVETVDTKSEIPSFTFKDTLFMDVVKNAFTLYMTAGKQKAMGNPALLDKLNNTKVSGQFTVTVTWPNELDVPASMLADNKDLNGFNNEVKNIFAEASRNAVIGEDTTVLTIVIDVVGPDKAGYVKGGDLEANLATYLPDFTLTCAGVEPEDFGTYTVKGAITGYTEIKDGDRLLSTVNYTGVQSDNGDIGVETNDMAATITVKRRTGGNTSGGGGGTGPKPTAKPSDGPTPTTKPGGDDDDEIDLSFDLGGLGDPINDIVIPGGTSGEIDLGDLEDPKEDGYDFDGWYYDPAFTRPATGVITVDKDTTLYAKWVRTTAPSNLNSDEHFAYIIGYPEGDVRPENNISRDEIATIFYRLLKADYRDSIFTADNNYSDVDKSWWSNKAISSITKGGYMQGYENGTFQASTPITRAEFAAVASRFYDAPETTRKPFSDVSGHWAEDSINAVATMGLVTGYEDGTFRPDEYITRAEAMTIFNRILVRYVNAEGLHKDAKQWPDNPTTAWYYYEVEEATNSHDYTRIEGSHYENWTAITTNQIWIDKPKYEDPDQ